MCVNIKTVCFVFFFSCILAMRSTRRELLTFCRFWLAISVPRRSLFKLRARLRFNASNALLLATRAVAAVVDQKIKWKMFSVFSKRQKNSQTMLIVVVSLRCFAIRQRKVFSTAAGFLLACSPLVYENSCSLRRTQRRRPWLSKKDGRRLQKRIIELVAGEAAYNQLAFLQQQKCANI